VSNRPKLAFARAIELLHGQSRVASGVDASAVIGSDTTLGKEVSVYPGVVIVEGASIGDRVTIYPGTVIGDNSVIGSDTTLYANVTVYDDCEIGRRVIIHGGTPSSRGRVRFWSLMNREGNSRFCRRVMWSSKTTSRSAPTVVSTARRSVRRFATGRKLDNLIQVAHNCALGEDTVVASQVGLSGSTTVGSHVVIAGQAATNQHVTINDNVVVGGQAGVTKSVARRKICCRDARAGTITNGNAHRFSYRSCRNYLSGLKL